MLFLFTLWSTLISLSTGAKINLRHSQTNKQFISQLDEGSFEIVHPFQIRDKNERIGIDTHNYFLNNSVHYKHVVIVIRSNTVAGIRLRLQLTLNEFVFLNETQFKKLDENGESGLAGPVENCYYQGTVNGDSTSFAAISTCNGLWGIIGFENGTTYGIWPLDAGDRAKRHPHVLYRTKWANDATCGAQTQTPARFLPLNGPIGQISSKVKRDVSRQTKYLELAVIGDHSFIKEFNVSMHEGIEYLLNAINIADLILFRDLKIHLSVSYMEIWLDAQRVDLHSDIQQTLNGALDYSTGHIYYVEKDATIMFTRGFFANGEMLSSTFSSVCTARSIGIVKAIDTYVVQSTAQFVTHVLGHIVGIDHDSSECSCEQNMPCIMNKQTGSIGSEFIWEFSKCSVARLQNVLQSEHVQCLLSRPFQTSRLHQCGNGILDIGEDCDCGRRDECLDPCCDPITCTLKANAQCASHQPCCHRCELRQKDYVCRESISVCDVPETCDGLTGDCALDGHLIDGVPCGINGHCWKGTCADSEQQCKDLWGLSAKSAEEPCYDHNQKGVEYGNCGTDRNSIFVACDEENIKCGTLYCRGGDTIPKIPSLTSFNLQFVHEKSQQQMQCKVITGSKMGLVNDGTNCAPGKICIENVCVPLSQVSPTIHCPSNNLALQCSGHGDCTTTQKCLCYDGWAGVACDIRSNTSRRLIFSTVTPNGNDLLFPSFNVGRTMETATLLGILLVVGVFLLLLLVCMLFCYRRKSSAEMFRASVPIKGDSDSMENINRAIKFGQMPSYREEKRKRKKNKRVYDALQRINEAAEERDSASLKSRESSIATASNITNNSIVQNGILNRNNFDSKSSNKLREKSPDSISEGLIQPNSNQQQTYTRENSIPSNSGGFSHQIQPNPSNNGSSRCLYSIENGGEPIYIKSQTISPNFLNSPSSHNPIHNTHTSYSPSQSDFCSVSNSHETEHNGYATDSELTHYHMNSGPGRGLNQGRSLLSNTGFRFPNSARLPRNQNIGGSKAEMSMEMPSVTQTSDDLDCMTPPLRLQSIQMLMNRLNAEENGMDKNSMELDHSYNTPMNSNGGGIDFKGNSYSDSIKQSNFVLTPQNVPEPPPASADSGHPCSSGSNYDIRESPSLFSDAFKLDLSN